MKNFEERKRYERAKERIEKQKKFYYNLAVYIIINSALLFMKGDYIIYSNDIDPESREIIKELFEKLLLVISILWGISLLFQGLSIFVKNFVLSKQWEENKIKEYMYNDDF